MVLLKLMVAVLLAALSMLTLATPFPEVSSNTVDSFFTSHLPTSQFASIDIAGQLPGECFIHGQITNMCPYAVYVRQAVAEFSSVTGERCDGFGETWDFRLEPGLTWVSERPTYFDGCGTSLKVSHNVGDLKVYQVEFSVARRNRKVWYNLSAEDGTPFQDVERYLAVGSIDCQAVHCAPGQYGKDPVHGCDWPVQPVCQNIGRVIAAICGRWPARNGQW